MSVSIKKPTSWIRLDALSQRFTKLGYAVLNDNTVLDDTKSQAADELEPALKPEYLPRLVIGNLTVGFFSAQGTAADGCGSRFDCTRDPHEIAPCRVGCSE
jgi:hypothetical protein